MRILHHDHLAIGSLKVRICSGILHPRLKLGEAAIHVKITVWEDLVLFQAEQIA